MEGIVKFGDEKLKEAFDSLKNFDRDLYEQIIRLQMKLVKMFFVEEM